MPRRRGRSDGRCSDLLKMPSPSETDRRISSYSPRQIIQGKTCQIIPGVTGVRQGLDRRPEPDSADGRSDGRGLLQDLDRCRVRFQRRSPAAGRSHRAPSTRRHPRSVALGPTRAKPSPLARNGCPPRIDRRRVHLTHRRNQHHHFRWPADLHHLRSARRVRAKSFEGENLCRSGSSQKAGTHRRPAGRTRRQAEGDCTQDERCWRLDDLHCRNSRGRSIHPVPQPRLDDLCTHFGTRNISRLCDVASQSAVLLTERSSHHGAQEFSWTVFRPDS